MKGRQTGWWSSIARGSNSWERSTYHLFYIGAAPKFVCQNISLYERTRASRVSHSVRM